MDEKIAYKMTGFAILFVGILFFFRDIGVNLIGNISGWTIIIVLVGAGLLAGQIGRNKQASKVRVWSNLPVSLLVVWQYNFVTFIYLLFLNIFKMKNLKIYARCCFILSYSLRKEVKACTKMRDKERCKIDWRFTKKDADRKLAKHYVA